MISELLLHTYCLYFHFEEKAHLQLVCVEILQVSRKTKQENIYFSKALSEASAMSRVYVPLGIIILDFISAKTLFG